MDRFIGRYENSNLRVEADLPGDDVETGDELQVAVQGELPHHQLGSRPVIRMLSALKIKQSKQDGCGVPHARHFKANPKFLVRKFSLVFRDRFRN